MTDLELKQTIEATRNAIQNKTGTRIHYSADLKTEILRAANMIGVTRFSQESGLDRNCVYRWSGRVRQGSGVGNLPRTSRRSNKKGRQSRDPILSNLPKARQLKIIPCELEVKSTPINVGGVATIRAGGQLEIQIPVSSLSPDWVVQLVRSLNAGSGGSHA